MWWCFMNSVVSVASNIRTIASDKLLKNVSLKRMHNSLIELFVDRTAIDNDNGTNDEDVFEVLRYLNLLRQRI